MYAKPWGIAPPPAAAGEQCYVAGHRRGAQQAHPNVWYRTAFLKCQMANGLKAVNHCVQLKRNVLRQSSVAQSYQKSHPPPPPFDNAKILRPYTPITPLLHKHFRSENWARLMSLKVKPPHLFGPSRPIRLPGHGQAFCSPSHSTPRPSPVHCPSRTRLLRHTR